jgi:hypothetical protein
MNRLIWAKAVHRVAQAATTRQSFKGIFSDERRQIILLDLPASFSRATSCRRACCAPSATPLPTRSSDVHYRRGNYQPNMTPAICIELQRSLAKRGG